MENANVIDIVYLIFNFISDIIQFMFDIKILNGFSLIEIIIAIFILVTVFKVIMLGGYLDVPQKIKLERQENARQKVYQMNTMHRVNRTSKTRMGRHYDKKGKYALYE